MDKQQFLEYDTELRTTWTLDRLKQYTVVKAYCIEKHVPIDVIDTYLPMLMSHFIYGPKCVIAAFDYYERKFGLCTLSITDSNGVVKVIKVY